MTDWKDTNPKAAVGDTKLPLHLWPETATALGCLAFLEGALKYGRSNWRVKGVRVSTHIRAARSHLNAYFEGEDIAPDSGIDHMAHALACIAIIVDARAAGKLNDDRQVRGGYNELVAELTPSVQRLREKYSDKNPRHYTIADDPHGDDEQVVIGRCAFEHAAHLPSIMFEDHGGATRSRYRGLDNCWYGTRYALPEIVRDHDAAKWDDWLHDNVAASVYKNRYHVWSIADKHEQALLIDKYWQPDMIAEYDAARFDAYVFALCADGTFYPNRYHVYAIEMAHTAALKEDAERTRQAYQPMVDAAFDAIAERQADALRLSYLETFLQTNSVQCLNGAFRVVYPGPRGGIVRGASLRELIGRESVADSTGA